MLKRKILLMVIPLLALLAPLAMVHGAEAAADFTHAGIANVTVDGGFFATEIRTHAGGAVMLRVEIPDYLARVVRVRREAGQGLLRVWLEHKEGLSVSLFGVEGDWSLSKSGST
ncbi:MAG: hypothetical protein ACM3ZC_12035 [Bacteroidota bacterium]